MAKQLLIPKLQPKQEEFCRAEGTRIGFGGAVGGGKSFVARIKAVLLALRYPGIQILLIRRTYLELYNNHVLPLIQLLKCQSPDKSEHIATFRDSTKDFTFPNGSRIVLNYCDSIKEVNKFQGQQYDVIFMEEATLFEEEVYTQLTTRNRRSDQIKVPFTSRMYFTSNPVGIGVGWFKKLFINNPECNKEGSGIVFIQSTVFDNPALLKQDSSYLKALEELPPKRKQALLYGDWNVLEGQFFEEFNEDIHTIIPFNIPNSWKIYRTRDYGYDMLATYWIAVDEQDFAYVYKEVYQSNLNISDAGKLINQVNQNDKIWLDLAPPDLFSRQRVDYRTTADIFQQECGHYLTKSTNDRVNGWNAVREWLKLAPHKEYDANGEPVTVMRPKLRIFKSCVNLIRCLPQLVYAENNPNDCATQPHEITHAPDALRGFCVSWTLPPTPVPPEIREKSWIEKALENNVMKKRKGIYIEW